MIFPWFSEKLLKQKAIKKLTETSYAPLPFTIFALPAKTVLSTARVFG